MTRKRWLDTLYCPRMQTKRLVFAREGPSMTFHSRPWCNRGAYISDIADAPKSVRVRNDEENDNTLRLRMLVIARIYSNLIYPRAVLRMTATDKRGVGSIRTGVETGFMRESFFASIRPLAAGHLQCVSCSPARRFCTTRMNSWKGLVKRKVWRHVTKISGFQQYFLTEMAICIVERWKKCMGYQWGHGQEIHTCPFFLFFCHICRTTVCWDPEILWPWQRDVTTSVLFTHLGPHHLVTRQCWVKILFMFLFAFFLLHIVRWKT